MRENGRDRPTALVLRALHLGDLLVAVPALRALRRALPDHRIVLATTPALAPLVELTGAVDELLPTTGPDALTWDRPSPDVAVNLHGRGPQSHHALDALSPRRRIGFRAPGWDGPEFDEVAEKHPHERERWCAMLAAHGIPADPGDLRLPPPPGLPPRRCGTPVLVHPGARYGSKRWPARRFAEVATALNCPLTPVAITGSADERDLAVAVAGAAGLAESRVLAGRTDLAQLCALVAGAALVVSGDTGVAHLAAAFGTPSVTLFGPVDPAQWGPPADGPHVTLGDADVRRGDPFADDPDPALLAVGVGDVLRAAARLRDHPRSRTPARAPEAR
ncbi:glycosyltransferase family 9 protein [Pseudonocardia kunmingensis]|uniref:glycosyltransferase family 9 protein n=1 Tax=Pseudonocardia kunmingensis TaxID=630975 RepID=UPI001B8829BF|nr:glycosyltransferase family 9 protein [Pseudonocardia kunmingensis]